MKETLRLAQGDIPLFEETFRLDQGDIPLFEETLRLAQGDNNQFPRKLQDVRLYWIHTSAIVHPRGGQR